MAMRLPMHGEIAARQRLPESRPGSTSHCPRTRTLPASPRGAETRCWHRRRRRPCARPSSVSLPAPLGPTTRTSRPGPIAAGASMPIWSALRSCHALPFAPDAAHHRNVARDMHADQVGALADRDLAAVGKADRFRRRLGDGANGGRKIDRRNALRQLQRAPSTGSRGCSPTTGCRAAPRGRDRPRRCCRNANRRAPRSARPSGCRCRPDAARARPPSWSGIPPPRRGHEWRR